MSRMPAVVLTQSRRVVLTERPVPEPRPDQVIVDVEVCGICGSDLHAPDLTDVYRGGFVMGHELAGRISRVGPEVAGWSVGDRVAVNPNGNLDHTCPACRAGRYNMCRQATLETAVGLQADGGLAPQVAVFAGTLHRLPDSVTSRSAGLVEPLATALRAVSLAGDLSGRAVLVTGGGPIGQLSVRIARRRGAGRIVLVEPARDRAAFGRASGADQILTPEDACKALAVRPVDVVVEASGSGAASALAVEALVPGGTLVVVGAGPGNTLDPTPILLKEIVVRGSFVYVDEFEEAIELLAAGRLAVDDLVTSVAPLDQALNAFDDLRRASTMKVLVAPSM